LEAERVPQRKTRANIPSRPTDGDLKRDQLLGKDKDFDYLYADPRQEQYGVQDYIAKGFEVVKRRAGGVRPLIESPDSTEGAEIKQLGCVLMSRPKAIGQGEFQSQQDYADAIDRQILKPGGIDGMRGVKGYINVRNQSGMNEKDEE
jgi:hypothetical protein